MLRGGFVNTINSLFFKDFNKTRGSSYTAVILVSQVRNKLSPASLLFQTLSWFLGFSQNTTVFTTYLSGFGSIFAKIHLLCWQFNPLCDQEVEETVRKAPVDMKGITSRVVLCTWACVCVDTIISHFSLSRVISTFTLSAGNFFLAGKQSKWDLWFSEIFYEFPWKCLAMYLVLEQLLSMEEEKLLEGRGVFQQFICEIYCTPSPYQY